MRRPKEMLKGKPDGVTDVASVSERRSKEISGGKPAGGMAVASASERRSKETPRSGICMAILGLAIMAFGICRGEMPIVLAKAINICMECIGIG